jgi:hypothetical protein
MNSPEFRDAASNTPRDLQSGSIHNSCKYLRAAPGRGLEMVCQFLMTKSRLESLRRVQLALRTWFIKLSIRRVQHSASRRSCRERYAAGVGFGYPARDAIWLISS